MPDRGRGQAMTVRRDGKAYLGRSDGLRAPSLNTPSLSLPARGREKPFDLVPNGLRVVTPASFAG